MPKSANALVVMAKAPVAGEVKTRLVPPLSQNEAAEFYRSLLLDLLEHLASFDGADLYIAFTPENAVSWFREIAPAGFACLLQRGRDLGERMRSLFEDLFREGYERTVIIGSDLPAFPARFLEDAFRALAGTSEVVLGPSRDGGYYLIGLSRLVPEMFAGIPWGTGQVLEITLGRLARMGVEPFLLSVWFDVDTMEDLRVLEKMDAVGARTRGMLERLAKLLNRPHRL